MFIWLGMAHIDLTAQIRDPQPGQLLARGVCRHLASHGFACVEELVPARGLRVDVMALGPKGEVWIVECKSSRADFTSDAKWQGYLEWADRFFWAVDADFPTELLPDDSGLIIADAYEGEIIRMGPETRLAPARRKVLVQKFAVHAARRLHLLRDPDMHKPLD
ncbi:MmcB family DNA repair protein [Sulfitobacter sp. JB4-11]|uniref:MmcB family DNA repair protein n=1 Tax=Sulfitobacter rhodophyticola TaxID=3238304 RepID=UPI003D819765